MKALIERFGYTPQQCADMTWLQQVFLLEIDYTKTLKFQTMEEYKHWKASR